MKKRLLMYVMLFVIAINGFSQNTINDPFFDQVGFRGAFDASNDWTSGWANWTPQTTVYSIPNITIEGEITSNQTWTSNNVYLIKGFLYVRDGATLTIQPGTVIRGDKDTKGTLLIERGAKIMAEGTSTNPIVFTSNLDVNSRSYGDWGGIVLCGKAAINVPGGTSIIEGGPTSVYGGGSNPDNNDNSGIMKFVRIEFPGIPFVPDKEINGLTLGGVGKNTQLDYIQVSYCGDDSFEWFGGNVNAKHLIAFRGWDDDFDTDFVYSGMIQFAVSLRDKDVADPGSGSNGFESDNDASGSTNTPITSPIFSNISIFGPKYDLTTTINSNFKRAMHLRRNTQLKVYNSVFSGFPTGLFIDGTAAQGNATNGDLKLQHCVLSGMEKFFAAQFDRDIFTTTTFGNDTIADNANMKYRDPFNLNSPNFLLANDSKLVSGSSWGTYGKEEEANVEISALYPNPVSTNATLKVNLKEAAQLNITVYTLTGIKVKDIANTHFNKGINYINVDASNFASGMYLIQINDGSKQSMVKMMVR